MRSHVLRTYDVVSQDGDSYVLRSPDTVTATAADIRSAWKPAEEVVDTGGTFLRYSDDIVAVTPARRGRLDRLPRRRGPRLQPVVPVRRGLLGLGRQRRADRRHPRRRTGGREVRRAARWRRRCSARCSLAAPAAAANPVLDPEDDAEVAAALAEATEVQDVCYGYVLAVDDGDTGEWGGTYAASSGGEGVRAAEADGCDDGVVELVARITYTSDFSEAEDSASWDLVSDVPGLTISDVEDQGLSAGDLLDDGAQRDDAAERRPQPAPARRRARRPAARRARRRTPRRCPRARTPTGTPGQRLAAREPRPAGAQRRRRPRRARRARRRLPARAAAGAGRRPPAPPASRPARPLEHRMTLDLLDELVGGVLATLAYAAVGTVVLALGYVVLDAITPGNLRHLVYADHNPNAAVLAGANVLAVAGIVTTAIVTADDDLARGRRRRPRLRAARDRPAGSVVQGARPPHARRPRPDLHRPAGHARGLRHRRLPGRPRRGAGRRHLVTAPRQPAPPLRLPVGPRAARAVLLGAVFAVRGVRPGLRARADHARAVPRRRRRSTRPPSCWASSSARWASGRSPASRCCRAPPPASPRSS